MKKKIGLLLCIALCLFAMAACNKKDDEKAETKAETGTETNGGETGLVSKEEAEKIMIEAAKGGSTEGADKYPHNPVKMNPDDVTVKKEDVYPFTRNDQEDTEIYKSEQMAKKYALEQKILEDNDSLQFRFDHEENGYRVISAIEEQKDRDLTIASFAVRISDNTVINVTIDPVPSE